MSEPTIAAPADEIPETNEVIAPETAEDIKRRGNECFATKKYEEAIALYGQALKLDPDNSVLYSNRSACQAALKDWHKSVEDAKTSIEKDPNFIKAYYRLAIAQSELAQYDDAIITLKAALVKEPNNEQAVKQLKLVYAKKTGGSLSTAQKQKKPMSESQRKEAYELQEQTNAHVRDLKAVQARIASNERESRSTQMTMNQVTLLEKTVPLYRSVGKAFFLTDRESLDKRLESDLETLTRTQRDLTDRQEYLERRIASNTTNLQDLMAQYSMQ